MYILPLLVIYCFPVHVWNPKLPEMYWCSQTNKTPLAGWGFSTNLSLRLISVRIWGIECVHTSDRIKEKTPDISLLCFSKFSFSFLHCFQMYVSLPIRLLFSAAVWSALL